MTATAPLNNDFINPDPTTHSDETNRRVYELLSQGHSWLGLQTLYALADSGINDQDLSSITERMRVASVRGVQAGALQPGLILAKQGTDYQAGATSSLRGGLLDTKTDIPMPGQKKGLRPRTLNEQDASTQSKRQRIKQIKDSVTQADDGFKHFFDDPVLQKNPSAGLALARYLNGVLGPSPIKEDHLQHIQQQLQLQGFGRGLPVDGVMSPAWGAAQNQWKDSIYKSQLKGDKPGSISLGHALQALQALTPTNAWDAIIGYAKQLPAGARQLLGDVAGSTVQLGADLVDPNYYAKGETNAQTGYDVNAAVVNTLGGDTSPKEVKHAFQDNGGLRLLEDVSNLIMVSSLVGAAGRFGSAAGIEAAATTDAEAGARLSAESAFRGPGVIAKSLAGATGVNPAIPRAVAGAALGAGTTALAGGTPLEIGIGGVAGGALGAASNTQVFQNIPILGETGPFIENLASGDGLYYRVRQLVHAPYTWVGGEGGSGPLAGTIGAAARLGDTAFNQSLLLGGEAQGLAQLQDWVGGNRSTGFSKSVESTHTVDALNDAIGHRLGATVLGAHIAPSIDDLMFVFGGKGAEALRTTSSKQLGDVAGRVSQASTDAISEPGYAAAISRATAAENRVGVKTQPTLNQMIERAGGQDKFNEFWGDKIRDVSAAWGAERALAAENTEAGINAMGSLSDQSRVERLVELKHEILHDPAQLQSSIEGLRAQAGGEELVVRLKRDIAYGSMSPQGPQNVAADYLDAKHWFRDWIHPTHDMKGDLWANAPSDPNNFGFASVGRESVQQANRKINEFQGRWNDLLARENADPTKLAPAAPELAAINAGRPSFGEYHALESEMFDYLHQHLGIHGPDMPEHGTEMIATMRENAKLLGADVHLHPDAPDVLKEAVANLRDRGYKPFAGTDIGYNVVHPSTIDATEGPLGFVRRVVEHAGLNPTTVPNASVGTHLWTDSVSQLQQAVDRGEIAFPAGADPVTMLSFLQQEGVVEGKRGKLVDAIGRLGVSKVATDLGKTMEEAQAEIDSFPVQFRDWSRKKFVETLSGPKSGEKWAKANPGLAAEANRANPAAHEAFQLAAGEQAVREMPPMSRAHAERMYQVLVDAAVPDGYYAGAAKIEDIFRADMGLGGKAFPQNQVGWAMANLPNRLIQLRNDLRFDLSPAFSFRRWFKSGVKGALEGVPPVWDPVEAMQRDNSFARSRDIYERVRPSRGIELDYLDSASRYLKSQDIFGLYNGAMTEARAAGIWAGMGKTDQEIDRLLTKTFEYGSKGVEGRSALERSTNFVFFPFSFEKTLYRNLGGYLLDKPAQRLVLTRALAAYDDFNKNHMDGSNPLATSFYEKHLPILQEAARLNAFSQGLSLGEPGGINRPLLNLFLPQSWNANQTSLDSLHRFVPAIADFQRILGEANDQTSILHGAIDNLQDDLKVVFGNKGLIATQAPGGQYNAPGPRKSTLTTQEQINEGFKMQLAWISDNKKFIDYNAGTRSPTDKYRFPLTREWGRLAGQPITAQNIRKIVSYKYPAFKAESAVTTAVTNSQEWNDYVLDQKGQRFSGGEPKYQSLLLFQNAVKDFAKSLVDDRVTTAQRAERTDELRHAAIYIAGQDPTFYRLYHSNFQKFLGPLETAAR